MDDLFDQLLDWLRIPSISTGGGDPAEIERAAEWAAGHVRRAGGEAQLVRIGAGNPLVVGDLKANRAGAPTVLIYGHYDVQGPGDLSAWTSPPFEPEVRDGRLYARGAGDDKGNFWPLLAAACDLAAAGELPVDVRVVVEGEEEAGSESIAEWIRADERGADAAIVFDSGMADEHTPAITVGLRGLVMAHIEVRTGVRDLHSGIYGGSALNALHVLHRMIGAIVPGPDGAIRDELLAGVRPPAEAERISWERLPPGAQVLSEVGGRPAYPGARTSSTTATAPIRRWRSTRSSAASRARWCRRSPMRRSRSGWRPASGRMRSGCGGAAPARRGARRRRRDDRVAAADPWLFEPDLPALVLAAQALERATGTPPALVRSGGSIPVVAEFAARGIPTIVSGFTPRQRLPRPRRRSWSRTSSSARAPGASCCSPSGLEPRNAAHNAADLR